jgi:two-component sensor histidine kinase
VGERAGGHPLAELSGAGGLHLRQGSVLGAPGAGHERSQQRALTDPASKVAVGDTRQRIAALALIYRTLYQSDDLRYADARIFLTELVGQLVASESGRGQLVTSSVEADSLVVDPDKLAPLALWLVEAVTNAQKHAFTGRGGDLKVRFFVRGETSVLEVQDDGPGVSETFRAGVGRTLMGAARSPA